VSKRWGPTAANAAFAAFAVIGLAMSGTAAAQAPECSGKNAQISKPIKKPMSAAFDAVKAQNWPEVLNQVAIAQADPKPKAMYDEFWIHKLLGSANAGQKKYAEAGAELEKIADSPCMTDVERLDNLKLLTQVYYQVDNYPKVIEYGNRALKGGAPSDFALYVGQAYYLTQDYKSATSVMKEIVAKLESEGQPPGEQNLRIIHGACAQLDDKPCVAEQSEKLVKYYPKPEYWQSVVVSMMRADATDNQMLNVMRLAMHVDAMNTSDQFTEMAEIALNAGLPGEAISAIDAGKAKNVFKEARKADIDKLMERAKSAADIDKKSLAQQDTSAKANAQGNADVKLGAAYLSYGDPAKAIEVLNRGISKGGVRNPDEAGLLLGIAYLKSGNKPEAAKAFQSVNKDPTLTRVAKLWLLNT
jgi:tetratricopeptide (TPR) repeat protein